MSPETPAQHHFGSPRARKRDRQFNQIRRHRRWCQRPLSDQERAIFERLEGWCACGSSLAAACLNSDVTESRFCTLAVELAAGRNSEFSERLSALLKIPWHWQSVATDKPLYYRPHDCIKDYKLGLIKWDD